MTRAPAGTHERLSLEESTRGPSNRSVGLVFSAVFTILSLAPMLRGNPPRWWAVPPAVGLLAVALLFPRILTPLNRAWFALGLMLHAGISPLIMALLYYTTVTPLGLLLRLLGKDLLRLRIDRAVPTYWIDRVPPGPAPDTMGRQF
jgi:hypothetical protein